VLPKSVSLACCLLCLVFTAQASGDGLLSTENFYALPIELEFDSGATNGDATFLKFTPLYKLSLSESWSLINLNLLLLADAPAGVPGSLGNPSPEMGDDKTFGLGDLTHISVFTPTPNGSFIYGIGFITTIPTATDSALGSEKWSLGPAFRVVYREGPWNLGLIGGNQWSYAGDGDRGDINQLVLRGAFRRQLANNWYLVSAPAITANWKAKSGQTWLLPLGGGIGKVVGPGSTPWAISVQGYSNVVKPDGAPDWLIRFAIVAPIPIGLFIR
jgi:hypothetical protein